MACHVATLLMNRTNETRMNGNWKFTCRATHIELGISDQTKVFNYKILFVALCSVTSFIVVMATRPTVWRSQVKWTNNLFQHNWNCNKSNKICHHFSLSSIIYFLSRFDLVVSLLSEFYKLQVWGVPKINFHHFSLPEIILLMKIPKAIVIESRTALQNKKK